MHACLQNVKTKTTLILDSCCVVFIASSLSGSRLGRTSTVLKCQKTHCRKNVQPSHLIARRDQTKEEEENGTSKNESDIATGWCVFSWRTIENFNAIPDHPIQTVLCFISSFIPHDWLQDIEGTRRFANQKCKTLSAGRFPS